MAAPATPPEFYTRLERFARSTGMSMNAFGLSVGFPPGTFSRILRDQVAVGVHHIIEMLTIYPDLNPRWLLLGEPPMLLSQKERAAHQAHERENLRLRGENEALREVIQVWSARMRLPGASPSELND